MIKTIFILSIFITVLTSYGKDKVSDVFKDMTIEPYEEEDIPYINELKKYLVANYGESFCKKIAFCFLDEIESGRRFSITSYDKNNKRNDLTLWTFKFSKGYRTYHQLPSNLTSYEVLQLMGKTFLNYYFKKNKGIDFNYPGKAIESKLNLLKAKAKGITVKITYWGKDETIENPEKAKNIPEMADVYFKYTNKNWVIVKVDFVEFRMNNQDKLERKIIGTLNLESINKTIEAINKDTEYKKQIIFQQKNSQDSLQSP